MIQKLDFEKEAAQIFFLERVAIAFGMVRAKTKILMQSRCSQNEILNYVRYKY